MRLTASRHGLPARPLRVTLSPAASGDLDALRLALGEDMPDCKTSVLRKARARTERYPQTHAVARPLTLRPGRAGRGHLTDLAGRLDLDHDALVAHALRLLRIAFDVTELGARIERIDPDGRRGPRPLLVAATRGTPDNVHPFPANRPIARTIAGTSEDES